MSSKQLIMFPASAVAARGEAGHVVASLAVPVPKTTGKGTKPPAKAPTKSTAAKTASEYVPAKVWEATCKIGKGCLFYSIALRMPLPKSDKVEEHPNILLSWNNPRTTPDMGRISRGTADPSNPNDKRNTYEKMRGIFEIWQSRLGHLGAAIGYIDRDFAKDMDEINKKWTFEEPCKDGYRHLVSTHVKKTDEETGDVTFDERENPTIAFRAYVGEKDVWSEKSYPTAFRGRRKTIILDYNKKQVSVDPKTGKTVVKYEEFTLLNSDGDEVAVDDSNMHLVLRSGNIVHRIEAFIDKATHSKENDAPHMIAHTIVVEDIPAECQEADYGDDEDAVVVADVGKNTKADSALAAAAASADDEPTADDEPAADDDAGDEAADEPEPEPAPKPAPKAAPKPAPKAAPKAAPKVTPKAATTKKPAAAKADVSGL